MRTLSWIYTRFTSCSGCQLMLLNCEEELHLLAAFDLRGFAMASSSRSAEGPVDLALVEGSISRPQELTELLALRQRARVLVAVGACALTGGVNALGEMERSLMQEKVYGDAPEQSTFPPLPLKRFVSVDLELPGCPPEKEEYLRLLGAMAQGGLPPIKTYPVCMECRLRENLCLLIERREACLGPVTRAGCDARCPSVGIGCEGCRGLVAEANRSEEFRLLLDLGLSEKEVRRRMKRFSGEGP